MKKYIYIFMFIKFCFYASVLEAQQLLIFNVVFIFYVDTQYTVFYLLSKIFLYLMECLKSFIIHVHVFGSYC